MQTGHHKNEHSDILRYYLSRTTYVFFEKKISNTEKGKEKKKIKEVGRKKARKKKGT